ncbi:MAG: tryptophan 7-halogenase [Bacteriovoracaceae bacterium]
MNFDAIVIGGGPAGTSAATLLKKNGLRTLLLEKEVSTPYKVGESLLPSALAFFDILGVREKVESHGFTKKNGAFLRWGRDPEPWSINFGELSGNETYSYQVVRSEFDELLLSHAESVGVEVIRGAMVNDVSFSDKGIKAITYVQSGREYSVEVNYLIDATGQRGLLSNRYLNSRVQNESFQNIAIWSYWEEYEPLPGDASGNIITAAFRDGWIWGIPLHDGRLSVGVVQHKDLFMEKRTRSSIEEIYETAISCCKVVSSRLVNARQCDRIRTAKDYSYKSNVLARDNYFLAGDAACFLDPVLSSGVHLAMLSGTLAACSITGILNNVVSAKEAIDFYSSTYSSAYLRFMHFLSAFYNQNDDQNSYFWKAQSIASSDSINQDLKSAFLNLVTGVKDLDEVELHSRINKFMKNKVNENLNWRKQKKSLKNFSNALERKRLKENEDIFNLIEGFDPSKIKDERLGISMKFLDGKLSLFKGFA